MSPDATTRTERFLTEAALPLHDELRRAAHRYARNVHDAEDLVQETYAKAWVGFDSFDPGTNLRAWMFRILVNTWISGHRKAQSRPDEILTDEIADIPVTVSAEIEVLNRHVDIRLRRALQALPENLQTTIFYADVCELPHKDIARMTDVPVGTVMSRVHRARKRLRGSLGAGADGHRAA